MPAQQGPKNSNGMPPGLRLWSPFPFSGLNTQAAPVAISDQEFLWSENFIRIGDGKLRTSYDAGAPLYRVPPGLTIVSFFPYTLGSNYYFAVFLSDGSAFQVGFPGGAITEIGPAGTFYQSGSGFLPACSQWGVQYLLISNRNTENDYWAWDGTLLYGPGTCAPNGVNLLSGGSNYNLPPTITAFGGFGSGISLRGVVNAGSVVNVEIENPGHGYEAGDIVQAQFTGGGSDTGPILVALLNTGGVAAVNITAPGSGYTAPTVSFSGGGGSGAAATATIGSGVASVAVTAPGSNYTFANVFFSGGAGSGATATAVISGGQVTEIDVVDSGSDYTSAPTVTISGDGSGATATATIEGGQIVAITMTDNGTGYTSAPSVSISDPHGTGATAEAVLGASQLSSIQIENAGNNFIQQPLLQIQGGGGTGAVAWTTIGPTSVSRVDVVDPGQNYQKAPTVMFLGGPLNVGSAKVNVTMNGGAVGAVNVTNGGSGYGIQPEVLFVNAKGDNTGGGATARAILSPHVLHQVIIQNYGLGYTTAPAVIVQPGANNAAYATIDMMPFGLSGSCIETFQQRVWIGNPAPSPFNTLPPGGFFNVTAAQSIIDVATSEGGVLFTNADSFLQTTYVAIKQSNGYIYFFGDGSVSVVSNVQTSGNPPTTTFQYQTVDPQVGCTWRDTCQDFGRDILFANNIGIFDVVGGSAVKVSQKLDGIFLDALFPPTQGAVTPSAAMAHIFDIKHYLILMTVIDPDTDDARTVILARNDQGLWYVLSQSIALTYIATQKRNSQLFAWGTDGRQLYPLFAEPSATLQKRLDTKLFGAADPMVEKDVLGFYMQAQDQTEDAAGISAQVSFAVSGPSDANQSGDETLQSVPSQVYTVAEFPGQGVVDLLMTQPEFQAPSPFWPLFGTATGGIPAINCGARLTTTSPDFVLSQMFVAYTLGPALI
jgi:hypothetical protein